MLKKIIKLPFLRYLLYKILRWRALFLVQKFDNYLNKKCLDIGCGTCNIAEIVDEKGNDIEKIDVQNKNITNLKDPMIYDGDRLPFADKDFDTSLLITVLHHCDDPMKILHEASRVSKRIIIIEDIYTSDFHKYYTFMIDSVLNLEFWNHPHNNKSEKEWELIFNTLNFTIIHKEKFDGGLFIKQICYVLDT